MNPYLSNCHNIETIQYGIPICANNMYTLSWKELDFNKCINMAIYVICSAINRICICRRKFMCCRCFNVEYIEYYPKYEVGFLDISFCSNCDGVAKSLHDNVVFKNNLYELSTYIMFGSMNITRVAICENYHPIYHIDATVQKNILFEDCNERNCIVYNCVARKNHEQCQKQKLKILNEELAIFRWILIESDNFPIDVIDVIIKLYYNIINRTL